MEIIGQDVIIKEFTELINSKKLPKATLLVGPVGSGKHLVASFIAQTLNYEEKDITDTLSYDNLCEMYLSVRPYLYLINIDKLTENTQNELLKLLEDPPQLGYILVLCSNQFFVLNTIKNRCYIRELCTYSKNQLKNFLPSDDDGILEYCYTPGDVLKFQGIDYKDINSFCEKIFDKIGVAAHSNLFRISDKISWKGEDDLINEEFFFRVLLNVSYKKYMKSPTDINFSLFDLTNKMIKDNMIPRVNHQHIFEKYLFSLRGLYDKS